MYLRKITLLTLSLALLRLYSCTNKPTVISGSFDQDVDFVLLSNAEVDIVNRNKKCSDFGKKNYSGNGNSLCSNFGNNSAVTVVLN